MVPELNYVTTRMPNSCNCLMNRKMNLGKQRKIEEGKKKFDKGREADSDWNGGKRVHQPGRSSSPSSKK